MRHIFWAFVVFVCMAMFAVTIEPQQVSWVAGSTEFMFTV
jgi:hypothetical protein